MIRKQAETLYKEEIAAIAKVGGSDGSDMVFRYGQLVGIATSYLQRLKKLVVGGSFDDRAEEIAFFKTVKPLFNAQVLYHVMLEDMEREKPHRAETLLGEYYKSRLESVLAFFVAKRLNRSPR